MIPKIKKKKNFKFKINFLSLKGSRAAQFIKVIE